MLGTLCSLLAALTCVSAVAVLTQPSVVTLTTGETASIDCTPGSDIGFTAFWYKQIPGGVPQFVLRFHQTWTDVKYGSGFSAPHFTSTFQSKSDCRLIINNVEEEDSAVYHCATWDSSANEWPETFPLHTDNMLGTLCSLLAALTCVSAVAVVTQPSDVTLTTGETASIDCNLGSVTDSTARWYKQIPGGVPQFVLHFHQTWTDVKYGSGFSAPHFTSTCQSKSDCCLIINNVEEGDSAVYHCLTWDGSAKENVSQ
ncbi:unnamed protein product [Lota lota]